VEKEEKGRMTNYQLMMELTHLPRLKGPGSNAFSFLNKSRVAITSEYAVYCALTERLKIAPIATGPAKTSRPRRKAPNAPAQTHRMGVWVREFMW
jgi:hypothetical protein